MNSEKDKTENVDQVSKLVSDTLQDTGVVLDGDPQFRNFCAALVFQGKIPSNVFDDKIHELILQKEEFNKFLLAFLDTNITFIKTHTVTAPKLRVVPGHVDYEKELTDLENTYDKMKYYLNVLTVPTKEEGIMVELFKLLTKMRDIAAVAITKQ